MSVFYTYWVAFQMNQKMFLGKLEFLCAHDTCRSGIIDSCPTGPGQ